MRRSCRANRYFCRPGPPEKSGAKKIKRRKNENGLVKIQIGIGSRKMQKVLTSEALTIIIIARNEL